jgi:hypothetical protein
MTPQDASRLHFVIALDSAGKFKTAFIGTNPNGAKRAVEQLILAKVSPEYILQYSRPRITKAWDKRRQNELRRTLPKPQPAQTTATSPEPTP